MMAGESSAVEWWIFAFPILQYSNTPRLRDSAPGSPLVLRVAGAAEARGCGELPFRFRLGGYLGCYCNFCNYCTLIIMTHHKGLLALCVLLLGLTVPAVGFELSWSLGGVDDNPDEFGAEAWGTNAAPGSAGALDDDYYFAGTYPAPIGEVAASEPLSHFAGAVTTGSPISRIHFPLTAAQTLPSARVRLVAHMIRGWFAGGKGFGTHTFQVRLNGALLGTQTLTYAAPLVIEAPASALINGANTLQIERVNAPIPYAGISFDALSFEVHPTGMTDADHDGVPRYWEEHQGLSDTDPADAALDPDKDALSNLQEFTLGTDPRLADTDGDGLSDSQETTTHPLQADTDGDGLSDGFELAQSSPLNPNAIDSDSDGAPDGWEMATGFSATSATSTPPPFPHAIGINFTTELHPANTIPALAVAGYVPQMNWNHTRPLTTWNDDTGTQADIVSPAAGQVLNSAGAPSGLTFSWSSQGAWGNGNRTRLDARLFDGFLQTADPAEPVTLQIGSIRFATYDVIVHVGSSYEGARGFLRLNNAPATDTAFTAASTAPETRFLETQDRNASPPWKVNTIRFRGLTTNSCSLQLFSVQLGDWAHQVGIHAVQIVNATADLDNDSMPDGWEVRHRLNPALASDAALDPDNDQSPNLAEYQRQTDPHHADTDGDGLLDGHETLTGTFVSPTNTGTDPLRADSDGDGLTDGAEVHGKPFSTNPNLADTDGDSRSDAAELANGTHPLVADAAQAHMPVITTSPRTFNWQIDNVQLLWDHERGAASDGSWGDSLLFSLDLRNSAAPNNDALRMALRTRHQSVTHFFYSNAAGAFSAPGSPTEDLWESDWSSPPANLLAGLGFSGHGSHDISDRLRFRVQGSSTGGQNAWTFTFTLTNLDTNSVVVTRTFASCRATSTLHHGTASWQNDADPPQPNRFSIQLHPAVQSVLSATRLEDTPAYAAHKDSDNDGMPDVWEDLYTFNKNGAADAALDPDLDGLTNLQEYLNHIHPRQADTDGDGVPDGIEVTERSHPLLASSRPPYWLGAPPSVTGGDLNGNGMSDAWERWVGRFDLNPTADADHDGARNWEEAVAGTDPLDPTSYLWSNLTRTSNDLVLTWPTLSNKVTQVQHSSTLLAESWTNAPGSPIAAGSVTQQNLGGPSDKRFFRVTVSEQDSDSDGVPDWDEIQLLGTDPLSANSSRSPQPTDTTGDGTPDTLLSGDYLTLLQTFQGSTATGGFPNATPGGSNGTAISPVQAARFLTQASFGPTLDSIDRVRLLGYTGWITEQKAAAPTLHSAYAKAISDDLFSHRADLTYSHSEMDHFLFGNNLMTAFARAAIQGEDQLRQRVAFALSQIIVTSRRDAELENRVLGMASYYDIFVRHAFGHYLDILREVTFHPVMGRYLSHVGNAKARPEINQFPNENYARELMQLFTIGLWQLHPDGTRQTNAGQPISTYSNTEITQLARVFTGFWFGHHNWGQGGWTEADYATPLSLHSNRHDFGPKTLVSGHTIPARAPTTENARRDVEDALLHLLQHPNTAPFVSRQLIQFLVTDNPTPAYVQRIATLFIDNGQGVRGDLGTVIPAILLDPEARASRPPTLSPEFGRLKEPVMRTMALGRAFGLQSVPDLLWWDWGDFYEASRQEPTRSPSVFNFYRPDYRAPGLLTQAQLAGPVFQITDSFSAIAFPNHLWQVINEGFHQWNTYQFPLDIAREIALASQPAKLIDHLNLLLAAGNLRPSSRGIILSAVEQLPATRPVDRARLAIYLVLTSPESAIMR